MRRSQRLIKRHCCILPLNSVGSTCWWLFFWPDRLAKPMVQHRWKSNGSQSYFGWGLVEAPQWYFHQYRHCAPGNLAAQLQSFNHTKIKLALVPHWKLVRKMGLVLWKSSHWSSLCVIRTESSSAFAPQSDPGTRCSPRSTNAKSGEAALWRSKSTNSSFDKARTDWRSGS